jgi:phenylacetate-CoA ligase
VSDALLQLYHRLPPAARSLAASLRGLYLRSWRYGPETERLVEEAREREHWSAETWQRWQEARLAQVLERAATRVPYYRDHWNARRRNGDRASWELLENWPILEKESLRSSPRAFVADDCDVRRLFHEHTSGTSGTPLDLWWSRATVRAWYALFEARIRRWHGVSRFDRWAIFGGQLVAPIARQRPPFWVWNAPLNQLYVSSYHLSPQLIPACLDALRRYRVTYVFGYSSSLDAVAQVASALGEDIPLRVAITNAEPLLEHQRDAIARGLGCPVRETYGMSELVAAAGECEAGRLHLWPEVGSLEVRDDDGAVSPGQAGELVCTGLLNADMPLVRYRVGDRGALEPGDGPCACGRQLPRLAYVEGRSDDVLYTRDGRRIGRLDPVFKGGLPLREAQIIQESLDAIRVRYVPAPGFAPRDAQSLVERLQARMGLVGVTLERVDQIPRTPNGKFRAVVCDIPLHERTLVSRA